MRKLPLFLIGPLLSIPALCQELQIARVPPDPFELVTNGAQTATTAEQRAALIALIERAVDNYSMHAKGTPPHVLQISFNATASTLFAGGAGQLRETWASGQNWRWDASLGGYSLVRVSSNGIAYDQQSPRPIPFRLKMLANAVFNPVTTAPRQEILRAASSVWNGAAVKCILVSPRFDSPPQSGARGWNESEYCLDPASGLLDIYSEAPGIYVIYDYSNALQFHGKELPGKVTVRENGATVIEAQLTTITDTDPSNSGTFAPTAQMVAQGPAVVLFSPMRARAFVPSSDVAPGSTVEPAIVHVTVDEQGNVQESDLLQTSGSSAKALDYVTHRKTMPAMKPDGAPPRQREVFFEVQFRPQMQEGDLAGAR